MKYTKEIDQYLYIDIERLKFQIESRKELISFCIRNNMTELDQYKQYNTDLRQFVREYEQAKIDFQKTYIEPLLNNMQILKSWNIQFLTHTLTYEVEEKSDV